MKNLISPCGDWKVYGSAQPKILIAGHSHTFALYSAITNQNKFRDFFAVVAQSDFSTHIQQSENYWNFVASIAENQPVGIMWNGNQHNIHFLLDSELKCNFYGLPIEAEMPQVPVKQIHELFKPTFEELTNVLKKFSKNTEIILLGTPGPKDSDFLNSKIANDPYFVKVGRDLGLTPKELRASNNSLRAYMWNVTQTMTKELAEDLGYTFISTPNKTLDDSLILKSEYYSDDLTHANELFGKEMLETLLNSVGIKND
jgi:hypothetical protein